MWDRCLPRRPTPGSVLCKPDMLCTYVVGDTSDCGSSGVGAPQGALSPAWSGQSGLARVVHYSNLPACTTRLVSSHHAVTQPDEPSVAERRLSWGIAMPDVNRPRTLPR